MSADIQHFGTVEAVGKGFVRVRILQASACSSCSAAQLCKSSESKEKLIDVHTDEAELYSVGQSVKIIGSVEQGLIATWWAYVLPLFCIVVSLVVVSKLTHNDGLAAVVSLLVAALYALGLYLMRSKLERKFLFKLQNN